MVTPRNGSSLFSQRGRDHDVRVRRLRRVLTREATIVRRADSRGLRVGVVGAGGWGKNHVRVWDDLGYLRLVCDLDEDRLRGVTVDRPHLETESDYRRVLQRDDIDAVVVATPARTHHRLTLEALDAGKHVLVEKPLALTLREAEEIATVAHGSGLVLMVDHVLEYHPAVEKLHELVSAGELGRILYLSAHRLNFGRVRTEEDALWSFAPHDLSLMLRIVGERPSAIACRGGAYLSPTVSDVTLMDLAWSGNVRGYVFVSWLHPFKEHRFVIVGDRQMAVFDDTLAWDRKLQLYPHRVDWEGGRVPVARKADAVCIELEEAEPLQRACEHFVESIRSGGSARTGVDNGLDVVALLEAGRRSLERGGTVEPGGAATATDFHAHPTATVDPGAVIGAGTKIWHYVHVSDGARIGRDCVLGQNVYVAPSVRIGDGVRVQNNVSVYDGVELEDHVFCGPSSVFTNVRNPRSEVSRKDEYRRTIVREGATIGANSTIVAPVEIGRYGFVAAGALVTRDVQDFSLVAGIPARPLGWMCTCGERLLSEELPILCTRCDRSYMLEGNALIPLD